NVLVAARKTPWNRKPRNNCPGKPLRFVYLQNHRARPIYVHSTLAGVAKLQQLPLFLLPLIDISVSGCPKVAIEAGARLLACFRGMSSKPQRQPEPLLESLAGYLSAQHYIPIHRLGVTPGHPLVPVEVGPAVTFAHKTHAHLLETCAAGQRHCGLISSAEQHSDLFVRPGPSLVV